MVYKYKVSENVLESANLVFYYHEPGVGSAGLTVGASNAAPTPF